ncbi:MAG TPA: thioredoxin domain-containing protein [Verrucomicrobiae bacterium]
MTLRRCLASLAAAIALIFIWAGCGNAAMDRSTVNVKHITQNEFEAGVIRSPQPVVVDFYATWCGLCRELSPELDRIAGGYTNQIKFVKVNYDEAPALVKQYEIDALPVVLLFKEGKVKDKLLGVATEGELMTAFERLKASN